MLIISSQLAVPLAEFRYTFSRSGGPGGQNVNKVNSKVTLHWNVAGSAGLPQAVRQRFWPPIPAASTRTGTWWCIASGIGTKCATERTAWRNCAG